MKSLQITHLNPTKPLSTIFESKCVFVKPFVSRFTQAHWGLDFSMNYFFFILDFQNRLRAGRATSISCKKEIITVCFNSIFKKVGSSSLELKASFESTKCKKSVLFYQCIVHNKILLKT